MPYELGRVETIIRPDDEGVISSDNKVLATVYLHKGGVTLISEIHPRLVNEVEEGDHVIVDIPIMPSPNDPRPQPIVVKVIKDEKIVNRLKSEIEEEPEVPSVPVVVPGQPPTPPPPPEDMFG